MYDNACPGRCTTHYLIGTLFNYIPAKIFSYKQYRKPELILISWFVRSQLVWICAVFKKRYLWRSHKVGECCLGSAVVVSLKLLPANTQCGHHIHLISNSTLYPLTTYQYVNNIPAMHVRLFLPSWEIENTRWVSFDIKFTRQGFENACWHREACRAIQHAFSKPSLVNLISKDANLVFYLSVYP